VLAGAVSQAEAELVRAFDRAAQLRRQVSWRGELETLRSVLHRDALPAAVAQKGLERLEDDVNRHLELVGADFRARVGAALTFRALFPDGRDVPAERLSGGEKVVFALAWRLAVNARFAADVGVLCLDEPTAGLDADRLGHFRSALAGVRTLSEASGLQLVVVTHDRSLLGLFDHVIELQACA
jgi:DNA repair exonuclease SbcCD ATPase subunit